MNSCQGPFGYIDADFCDPFAMVLDVVDVVAICSKRTDMKMKGKTRKKDENVIDVVDVEDVVDAGPALHPNPGLMIAIQAITIRQCIHPS